MESFRPESPSLVYLQERPPPPFQIGYHYVPGWPTLSLLLQHSEYWNSKHVTTPAFSPLLHWTYYAKDFIFMEAIKLWLQMTIIGLSLSQSTLQMTATGYNEKLRTNQLRPGMVVYAFNLSTWKTVMGRSLNSRLACLQHSRAIQRSLSQKPKTVTTTKRSYYMQKTMMCTYNIIHNTYISKCH